MKNAFLLVLSMGLLVLSGCRSNPDDAAAQAKDLLDNGKRSVAIGNLTRLYISAMEKASNDRNAAPVKSIMDASLEHLVKAYVEHPEDTKNGKDVLELLAQMRSVKGYPAFIKSLEWRTEISEDHAVLGAKTLAILPLDANQKGEAIAGISKALSRVSGSRGADVRMSEAFISALGAFEDVRGLDPLLAFATKVTPGQTFLLNRLAYEKAAMLKDPKAIPAFINALTAFDPAHPQIRVNDLAQQGLVRIGSAAVPALIEMLNGKDAASNKNSADYTKAVKAMQPNFPIWADANTHAEAAITLGEIGDSAAIEALLGTLNDLPTKPLALAEGESSTELEKWIASTISLLRTRPTPAQAARIKEVVIKVLGVVPSLRRPQLIVASQHAYDASYIDFWLSVVNKADEENARVLAFTAAALLANKTEAQRLKPYLEKADDYRESFKQEAASLALAEECDTNVACYASKLSSTNVKVARKAAYMVARLGNEADAKKIYDAFEKQTDSELRSDMLYAVDHLAVGGNKAIEDALRAYAQKESGTSAWKRIETTSKLLMARLNP